MYMRYVIRHMNIYIVITRINSELNCLIIMDLSCSSSFMLCYIYFSQGRLKKASKRDKKSNAKEGRRTEKYNSVQGHFSSLFISELFASCCFFFWIFLLQNDKQKKRLYEKLLLTYNFPLIFSIFYFFSLMLGIFFIFSFVRVIYFYVFLLYFVFFLLLILKRNFRCCFSFSSSTVFCVVLCWERERESEENKRKLCIYFHKPKKECHQLRLKTGQAKIVL